MTDPVSPQKSPYKVIVEEDKTYFWCVAACQRNNHFVMASIKKMGNINQLNIWLKKVKKYIFVDAK